MDNSCIVFLGGGGQEVHAKDNYVKSQENILHSILCVGGTRWCSWLRHCTTNWNVTGSIPDGVTGIFH